MCWHKKRRKKKESNFLYLRIYPSSKWPLREVYKQSSKRMVSIEIGYISYIPHSLLSINMRVYFVKVHGCVLKSILCATSASVRDLIAEACYI